jgi:dTDP-4-amino-4,6-dideoxygalactose transaminase
MIPKIPLLRPYFNSEELEEIQKVLDSGWVSQGPKVKEFEEKIAEYLGVKYAIAVTNCTSALHLALLSLGIKKDDEVLVADFTFPATGHSVLYCGANPIFVDVDLKTYNLNPELIEEKISDKTKAIIPVHTFGQPAEMDAIMEIAEDHNLKVIEDAACALGAKYKNKFAGTIGDIGCLSFHARKGITTGEGGMAVTNNKDLADKIRNLSLFRNLLNLDITTK